MDTGLKKFQQNHQDQLSVLIALCGNSMDNRPLLCQAWQQLSGKPKLPWSTVCSPGDQVRCFLARIPIDSTIALPRMELLQAYLRSEQLLPDTGLND